jgi:hypothetical protein
MELLIEVLKISIPALIVAGTVAYMMKQHYQNEARQGEQSLIAKSNEVSLPLKFQAYERLVLLMERVALNNMILRVSAMNMTVDEYKLELMQNVTHEFEHNISQQLYVSNSTWDKISEAKDYVLNTINNAASNLPGHEPSGLLVNSLIEHIAKREITPTIEAIYLLKKESATLG